jgi:transcriptional adapter 3
MSSSLVPYPSVHPFRSRIVKSTSNVIPPTEDLEVLRAELTKLLQDTLERARKADEDLRTIQESMRKLEEREESKAELVERTKRECV